MIPCTHEMILVVYMNQEKARALQHFAYTEDEQRKSHVSCKIPSGNEICRRHGSTQWLNIAQKPVLLMKYLVKHFSQSGSNVLDLCSGTGSTTIAALSLGRNAFSVETDREMRETLAFRVANLKAEMDAEAKEKEEEFKSSGPEVRKIKKKLLLSKKKGPQVFATCDN